MNEKVILKYIGGRYVVRGLENRVEPRIGLALSREQVDDLLLYAKVNKNLTVKVS